MSDQKEVKKEEVPAKDVCNHQHPGGATAWQFVNIEQSKVWTEQGAVPIGVVTMFCPYCYGTKQVAIG